MMKMLVCFAVDVDAQTTARKVIRQATKNKLLALARDPQAAAAFFRDAINLDAFLVRAPEGKPGDKPEEGAVPAPRTDDITAPKGSSGVG